MRRASRLVSLVAALTITAMLAFGGFVSSQPARAQPVAPDGASMTLVLLRLSGVDFSVPDADLKQWLVDGENTPYPAFAEALLIILSGKQLRQPVYLDVIVYKYEQAAGVSPRDISQIDFMLLRTAVVDAYNERYGDSVTDFASLVL